MERGLPFDFFFVDLCGCGDLDIATFRLMVDPTRRRKTRSPFRSSVPLTTASVGHPPH